VEPATTSTLPLGAPSVGTFCGPQFFDQASQVALENDDGVRGIPFVCYFSAHALTWVVVVPGGPRTALGDPVSGESPAPSWCATNPPAGAGIAVEHRSASDAACLAGSGHDLSQFTFYPFPDPTAEFGQPHSAGVESYVIDNGGVCGPLSFDVANGEWIIQSSREADALVAGTAPPFPPSPPSAPPYVMSTAVPLPASELAANHPVTCPVVPPRKDRYHRRLRTAPPGQAPGSTSTLPRARRSASSAMAAPVRASG
jgi:hypothetical protein